MITIHQGLTFFQHFLLSVDQHSLHSPFLYQYYSEAVKGTVSVPEFDEAEKHRGSFLANRNYINTTDFGTGNSSKRKIGDMAMRALASPGFCRFLYRTGNFLQANEILELGTCLGITTLYLASIPQVRVTTIEGCPETAGLADDLFQRSGKSNIRLVVDSIENHLPRMAEAGHRFNLIFVDANHRYQPTLSYYQLCKEMIREDSIMIIHDIHTSREMDQAWKEIQKDPSATQTLDFFDCGIVFFNPGLNRQNIHLSF